MSTRRQLKSAVRLGTSGMPGWKLLALDIGHAMNEALQRGSLYISASSATIAVLLKILRALELELYMDTMLSSHGIFLVLCGNRILLILPQVNVVR